MEYAKVKAEKMAANETKTRAFVLVGTICSNFVMHNMPIVLSKLKVNRGASVKDWKKELRDWEKECWVSLKKKGKRA